MDYPFDTNVHKLVLGCCGPCGLHMTAKTHLPAVRLVPQVFCICRSEDERVHTLLLELYEEMRARAEAPTALTDGFLDFACLTSAATHFGDRRIYLHRCLEHVKSDVKKEAKTKDEVSGQTRLRRHELLTVIIDCIEWSAGLASDMEFHVFWTEVLKRMEASTFGNDRYG